VVEEIPLYPASGEGTHTYFVVEKRGLTTLEAVRLIARRLGRNPRDIGYAGLKDAHGVTQQMLSLEHMDPAAVASIELGRVRVLSVNRHRNKIKLGHLAGNRFVIKVRETTESSVESARAVLDVLVKRGVPNYFGPQRFGARGDNALIGRAVLLDDFDEAIGLILGRPGPVDHGQVRRARELFDSGDLPASAEAWGHAFAEQAHICRALIKSGGDSRKAWRAVHHTLRRLYVSAFQSDLFNRVLARRIDGIDRLETGDIAWKHRNGACFLVEDAEVEQPRCAAFEISPTGPLFGRRMTEAQDAPGRVEAEVLAESGVTCDRLRGKGDAKVDGARRPLRVPLADLALDAGQDAQGQYVRLTFALPPGAYATSVIREVCKSDDR
jgi:tRNA pseudouridine13 synthase